MNGILKENVGFTKYSNICSANYGYLQYIMRSDIEITMWLIWKHVFFTLTGYYTKNYGQGGLVRLVVN